MAKKILSTQELASFLGISRQALKKLIDNNTLPGRLLELNYKLLGSEKQGRKVNYTLEEVIIVPKETWEELAAEEFPSIRKVKELGIHAQERLIKRTESTAEISNKAGVSRQTTDRWDGLLVEKGYMRDGGYTYYEIKDCRLNQITYAEYQKYWGNRSKTKAMVRTLTEAEAEHDGAELVLENIATAFQGSYCIRVKNYLVNQFTEKYQRIASALETNKG